eukprot:sb/3464374/
MLQWWVLPLLAVAAAAEWTEVGNKEKFDHNARRVEFKISDYPKGFYIRFYGSSGSYYRGLVQLLKQEWENTWKYGVGGGKLSCSEWNQPVQSTVPVTSDTVWRIWIGVDEFILKADGVKIASKDNCGVSLEIKKWEIEVVEPTESLVIKWRQLLAFIYIYPSGCTWGNDNHATGHNLTLTCSTGVVTFTCLDSGLWTPEYPPDGCTEIQQCSWNDGNHATGTNLTLTCSGTGEVTFTCQDGGDWSPPDPAIGECTEIQQCPWGNDNYPTSSTLTLTCPGTGEVTFTCGEGGNWSPSDPAIDGCTEIQQCPWSNDNHATGTNLTLTCSTGVVTFTCKEGGNWTPEYPAIGECAEIQQCPWNDNNYPPDHTLTLDCSGTGEVTFTCQEGGDWTPSDPAIGDCTEKQDKWCATDESLCPSERIILYRGSGIRWFATDSCGVPHVFRSGIRHSKQGIFKTKIRRFGKMPSSVQYW